MNAFDSPGVCWQRWSVYCCPLFEDVVSAWTDMSLLVLVLVLVLALVILLSPLDTVLLRLGGFLRALGGAKWHSNSRRTQLPHRLRDSAGAEDWSQRTFLRRQVRQPMRVRGPDRPDA